jgi:hypothetical protein
MPVTLAYHELFCFHGADESDTVPYMWVVGVTLDGRTITGDSGLDADVVVQPDPLNPLCPSVTTTADNDPTNNLGRLPQCPMANVHEEPV